MNEPKLTICFAITAEEKQSVVDFVQRLYQPKYQTAPPVADVYAFVTKYDHIVASMGLEFAQSDGRFQIEKTYRINRQYVNVPLDKENTVQLGRWASVDQNAGMVAAWAAVTYAIEHSKIYGLAEHDYVVHRHCERKLGVEFREIPHAPPDISVLPEAHRSFYAQGIMRPYIVDLRQIQVSLLLRIKTGH